MNPGNYGMVPETTYYSAPVYPSFSGYQPVQNPHPLYQGYYQQQPLPVHHGYNCPPPSMHYQNMPNGPLRPTTPPFTQRTPEQVQLRSHALPIISPPLPARVAHCNPPPPFPLPPRLKALGDMVVSRNMDTLKEDACHKDFKQLALRRGIEVRNPLENIDSNQQLTPTIKPIPNSFKNYPELNKPPVKDLSVLEPEHWPELKSDMKENQQLTPTIKPTTYSFKNYPELNTPPVKEQSLPEPEDLPELKSDMKENQQSTLTIRPTPNSFKNYPELNTPPVKKQSVPEPKDWSELKTDTKENCATNSKNRMKVGNNLNSGSWQVSTVSLGRSEEHLDIEEQWEDLAINEEKDHGRMLHSDVESCDIEIEEHEMFSTPFNCSMLTEDSDGEGNVWEPCVRITDGFENECSVDLLKTDDFQSMNFRQRASQYGISITTPGKSNESNFGQSEKNSNDSKSCENENANNKRNISVESGKSNNNKSALSKPLERLTLESSWSEDNDNSSYNRADTLNVMVHHKRSDDSGSDAFSLEGSQSDPVDAFKMKASMRGIRIEDPKDSLNTAPESDTESELGIMQISRSNSIDTPVWLRVSTPEPGVGYLNPEVPEFKMNLETTVSKLEDLPVQKTDLKAEFLNPDSPIFQEKQKKEQVHSEVSNNLTNLSFTDPNLSVSSALSMKSEAPTIILSQSTASAKIKDSASVIDTASKPKAKIFYLTSPVAVKVNSSVATQASPTITSSCVGTKRVKTKDCAMNTGSCETREVGINTGKKSDKKGIVIHASKTKLISKSTNTRQVAQRTVGVNVKFKVEAKTVDKKDASTMVDLVEYNEDFDKTGLINKVKDLQTELLNHKGKEVIHKLLQQKIALKKKSEALMPFFTKCEESETFSGLIMNKISSIEKSIIEIQVEMEETILQINSDKGLNQLPDFDKYLSLTHCLPQTYRPSSNLTSPSQHIQVDLSPTQSYLQSLFSGVGPFDDVPRHLAANVNANASSLASTCVFSQMCGSTSQTAARGVSLSSKLTSPDKYFHTSPLRLPEEYEFMQDKSFMNLDEQIKIETTCGQTGSIDQIGETSNTKMAMTDEHEQGDWEKDNTLEVSTPLDSYEECRTEQHIVKDNTLEASTTIESYEQCSTENHMEKNNTLEASTPSESYEEYRTEQHIVKDNTLEASTTIESYEQCSTEKHIEKDNTLEASKTIECYAECSTEKHFEKDNTLEASTTIESFEECSTETQDFIIKQSVGGKETSKATEMDNGLNVKIDVNNIENKELISQAMHAEYSGLKNKIENQVGKSPVSVKQQTLKSMDSIDSEEDDCVNGDIGTESVQKVEMKSETVEPLKIMHELHGLQDIVQNVLTVSKEIEYQEVDSSESKPNNDQELISDIESADVNKMTTEGTDLDTVTQMIINPPINNAIVDATVKSTYEISGGMNDLEECTDEEEDMEEITKDCFEDVQKVRAEENICCNVREGTDETISCNVKQKTEEKLSCTEKERTVENMSFTVKESTEENISCYVNKIKVLVPDEGTKQLDKAESLLMHHTDDSQLPVDISQQSSSQNDNQNLISAFSAKEIFMSPVRSSKATMAVVHPIRQPEIYPNIDLVPGIAPLTTGPMSLTRDLDPLLFHAVMDQLIHAYPQLAGDQVMLMNVAMQQTNILQMYMRSQQDSGADQIMGDAFPNILNIPCENPFLANPNLSLNAIQDLPTNFPTRSILSDNNGIPTIVSTQQSSTNTSAVSTTSETSTSCSVNSASSTSKMMTNKSDDFTMVKPNEDENLASSSKGTMGTSKETLDKPNSSATCQMKPPGIKHNLSLDNNANAELPVDAASCTGVSAFSRKIQIKAKTTSTTPDEVSKPNLTDLSQTRLREPQSQTSRIGMDLDNNPNVQHSLPIAKQADFLPEFAKKHNPCNVNTKVVHSFVKQLDDQVLRSINNSDEVHFERKTPSLPSRAEPERKYSFKGEQFPSLSDGHDTGKKTNQFRSSLPPSLAKQRQVKEPRNLYVPPNKRTEIPVLKNSTPQCIQQTEDWEEEANPFPQTFAINLHPPSKLIMKGKHNTGMEAKHNTGVVVKQCATMEVKVKCQDKVRRPSGTSYADICDIPAPKITKTEGSHQAEVEEEMQEDWCEVTTKRQRHKSKEQPAKIVSQSTLPSSNTKQLKMSNFEKLLFRLHEVFPGNTRQALMDAVAKIRTQRGSMSGLSMQTIIESVGSFIDKKAPKHIPGLNYPSGAATKNVMNIPSFAQQLSASNKPAPGPINAHSTAGPKHGLNIPRFTPSSIVHNIGYDDDEDICVICHDGLSTMETMELDCHHVYHYKCISQWVERDRTCPTCRKLALFPEDFPRLGR